MMDATYEEAFDWDCDREAKIILGRLEDVGYKVVPA